MIVLSVQELIGNTPVVRIPSHIHGIPHLELFIKLEYLNPFWSLKDRTALGILRGMPDSATQVIESSSGNTAKALGSLLSPREIPLHIVTNRIRIPEVRNLLQILGVHLEELPPGSDCPDPSDPQSPFEMIRKRVGADDDLYWTEQYKNRENPKIHTETLGPEILEEIPDLGFYFSGLGTTGSSRGIAEYARSIHSPLKNIGIITAGGWYIPGIRNADEMREVPLFQRDLYEHILEVSDRKGVQAMIELIRSCSIHCGPTTGAVFQGIRTYFDNYPLHAPTKALFVACDGLAPYVSYIMEKYPELVDLTPESSISKSPQSLLSHTPHQSVSLEEILHTWAFLSKYLLIDTRSVASFSLGHIPGSICIPGWLLREYLQKDQLPFDRDHPVVFICPHGEDSPLLSQIANQLGYTTYSLRGWYLGSRTIASQVPWVNI